MPNVFFKMVALIGRILFLQILLSKGYESLFVARKLPFAFVPLTYPSAPTPIDKISVNIKQYLKGETHLDVSRFNAHRKQQVGTITLKLLNDERLQGSTLNHHSENIRGKKGPKKRTSTKIIRKTNIESSIPVGINDRKSTYQYSRDNFIHINSTPNQSSTDQKFINWKVKELQQNNNRAYSEPSQRTAKYNRNSNQQIYIRRKQNNPNFSRQIDVNYNNQINDPSSRQNIRYPSTISLFNVRTRSRDINQNTNKRQWIRITIHNLQLLRRPNIEVFKSRGAIYVRDGNAINNNNIRRKQGMQINQTPSDIDNERLPNNLSNNVQVSHQGNSNNKGAVMAVTNKYASGNSSYNNRTAPLSVLSKVNPQVNVMSLNTFHPSQSKLTKLVKSQVGLNNKTKVRPPTNVTNLYPITNADNFASDLSGKANSLYIAHSRSNDSSAYYKTSVNPSVVANNNMYPYKSFHVNNDASKSVDSAINIHINRNDINLTSSSNFTSNLLLDNPTKTINFKFKAPGQAGNSEIQANTNDPSKVAISDISFQADNPKKNHYQPDIFNSILSTNDNMDDQTHQSYNAIDLSTVNNTDNFPLISSNRIGLDLSSNIHSINSVDNPSVLTVATRNNVGRGVNSISNTERYSAIRPNTNSKYVITAANINSQAIDSKNQTHDNVENKPTSTNTFNFHYNSVHNHNDTVIGTNIIKSNFSANKYPANSLTDVGNNTYGNNYALVNHDRATDPAINPNPIGEVNRSNTTMHKSKDSLPYVDRESVAVMNSTNQGLHGNVEMNPKSATNNYFLNSSMDAKNNTGPSVNLNISNFGDPITNIETIRTKSFGENVINQSEYSDTHNTHFLSTIDEITENQKPINPTPSVNIFSNSIAKFEPVINTPASKNKHYTVGLLATNVTPVKNNSSLSIDITDEFQPNTRNSFQNDNDVDRFSSTTFHTLYDRNDFGKNTLTEFGRDSHIKQELDKQIYNETELKEDMSFHPGPATVDTAVNVNTRASQHATGENVRFRNESINNTSFITIPPLKHILEISKNTLVSRSKVVNPNKTTVYPRPSFKSNISENSKIIHTQTSDIFSVNQGRLLHEASSSYRKNSLINETIETSLLSEPSSTSSSRPHNNIETSSLNIVEKNKKMTEYNHEESVPRGTYTNQQNDTIIKRADLKSIRENLLNDPRSSISNNQSSLLNIVSNGDSHLLDQRKQLDQILKTVRQVPAIHTYTFNNGTSITWITIDAETVVNTTRKEETGDVSKSLYQEMLFQPSTLAANEKQTRKLSAQTESLKSFNETGILTKVGGEVPETWLNSGVLPVKDSRMTIQRLPHGHGITNQNISNTIDAGVVKEIGTIVPDDIAKPISNNTKETASSIDNMNFQENAQTGGMQQNRNLSTVSYNRQINNSSLSLFNVIKLRESEHSTRDKNISSKISNTLWLLKLQTTTQSALSPVSTIPQINPVPKKDIAQRHTAEDAAYNEDPINIKLGKAVEPVTKSLPSLNYTPNDTEIIPLLRRYGIKTSQDLNTLLQNRNTDENSKKTLNSITSYFKMQDTKCPIDRPCLWCKASPSWSFVHGMTGWCMRNCKSSPCEHSRCKCSCVTDTELSQHLRTIASSDLRG